MTSLNNADMKNPSFAPMSPTYRNINLTQSAFFTYRQFELHDIDKIHFILNKVKFQAASQLIIENLILNRKSFSQITVCFPKC